MSKIIIYLKINKSLAKRGIEEVSRTAIYKAVHRSQDLGFERSAPVEKARVSACTRDKIEEYVQFSTSIACPGCLWAPAPLLYKVVAPSWRAVAWGSLE